uniref:Uncharacterized protein n=1 Tax=Klebsiella pneumoniae TaxID=573 RepID=A0A8B0SVF4_KLEPN|nr:hypothetical protein [Klebsiella pneumoniae]
MYLGPVLSTGRKKTTSCFQKKLLFSEARSDPVIHQHE